MKTFVVDKLLESELLQKLTDEEWNMILYGDRIEAIKAVRNSKVGQGLKLSMVLADGLRKHYCGIPIPLASNDG